MNYAIVASLVAAVIGLTYLLLKEYNAAFFMITVSNIWAAVYCLNRQRNS